MRRYLNRKITFKLTGEEFEALKALTDAAHVCTWRAPRISDYLRLLVRDAITKERRRVEAAATGESQQPPSAICPACGSADLLAMGQAGPNQSLHCRKCKALTWMSAAQKAADRRKRAPKKR